MYSNMYEGWIKAIENYRITYEKQSGMKPSDKLIIAFCKFRQILYPLPNKEEFVKGMIGKHEKVEEQS